MASQNLKQRTTTSGEDASISTGTDASMSNKSKRGRNMGIAKRGITSLAVAVSVPLSLTLISICLSSISHNHGSIPKPFWFLPLWVLHVTYMASSFLMGLSAWLVWADGGFHRNPTALYLYLAHLCLCLAWNPIVLGAGATRIGLLVCMAMFGALTRCYPLFREVNPIAADLTKLCLAWTAFLSIVNLKLVFV
nr:outer membrane tryptophan-rich sensory protein [Betula platyphylla]UVJ47671.1 outer membrane tryptophan-rich sensory protein [Betula platyphylla]